MSAESPTPLPNTRRPGRPKHVIYGRHYAVQVERDYTPARVGKTQGHPTLLIEAGPMAGRAPNWHQKLAFQLTFRELPGFAATVLRRYPAFESSGHGSANDKGLRYTNENEHAVLSLLAPKDKRTVRVGQTDAFWISMLAVDALRESSPDLDSQSVLSLLLRTHFSHP